MSVLPPIKPRHCPDYEVERLGNKLIANGWNYHHHPYLSDEQKHLYKAYTQEGAKNCFVAADILYEEGVFECKPKKTTYFWPAMVVSVSSFILGFFFASILK